MNKIGKIHTLPFKGLGSFFYIGIIRFYSAAWKKVLEFPQKYYIAQMFLALIIKRLELFLKDNEDPEDWRIDSENSACHHRSTLHLQKYFKLWIHFNKHNIFILINAALVSIRDFSLKWFFFLSYQPKSFER